MPIFYRWLTAVSLIGLIGCSHAPEKQPADGTPSGSLAGVRLQLLVVDDHALAEAIDRLRGEWQGSTGGELEISETSEAELLAGDQLDADAVVYPAFDLGEMAERQWLASLPDEVLANADLGWQDIFEADRVHDASWGKSVFAIPLGSPVLTCLVRADLLEKCGRSPPTTWSEYQALAEFFADRGNLGDAAPPADAAWSGTAEPLAPGWAGLTLLARAAAYAKHRNHYSALFDMDTMDPLIAGAPWVRALDELAAAYRLGSPDELRFGAAEAGDAFWQGRTALALGWPVPRGAREENSEAPSVPVAFVELPGSDDVYNPANKTWEKRRAGEQRQIPLLGLSGRQASVARQSPQAAAARQLLVWMAAETWNDRISAASRATTLFRQSHLEDMSPWVGPEVGDADAIVYGETVRDALGSQEWLSAPRIPGRARYLAALDAAVERAVQGEAVSQDALRQAADAWRKITAELGVDKQRTAYRHSLGLR